MSYEHWGKKDAVVRKISAKKVLLEILQYSQAYRPSTLLTRDLFRVILYKICEVFKNVYFKEYLQTTEKISATEKKAQKKWASNYYKNQLWNICFTKH